MTLVSQLDEAAATWQFTPHARRQMSERRISEEDVMLALAHPRKVRLNTYWGDGEAVLVDPRRLIVQAVLRPEEMERPAYVSAQRHSTQTVQTVREEIAEGDAAATLRRLTAALTQSRPAIPAPRIESDLDIVLEGIHPRLHEDITRLADGDAARILVHSPTNVEILPRRE